MPHAEKFDDIKNEKLEDGSVLALSRDLGFFVSKSYDDVNLYPTEEESEDFLGLGKKAKAKRKRRRELRSQGLSRKDARRQARKEVGKTKVGKFLSKVGEGAKKVGKAVKTGALALPRNAFLLLVKINYRGWGDKFAVGIKNPKYAKKLKAKWEKLGGRYSVLKRNIEMGEGKRPVLCGRTCKVGVEEYRRQLEQGGSFDGMNFYDFGSSDNFLNGAGGGVGEAGVGVTVAKASIVSGALTTLINEASKAFVENAGENIGERMAETLIDPSGTKDMPPPADTEAYLERQILQNSDLTPQQKQDAIADLRSSLSGKGDVAGGMNKTTKYALIGGGVLLLGIIVYAIAKK